MQQSMQADRAAVAQSYGEPPRGSSRLKSAWSGLRDKLASLQALSSRSPKSADVSRERLRDIIGRDRALLAQAGDASKLSEAARALLQDPARGDDAELSPSLLGEIERWIEEQIADVPESSDPVSLAGGVDVSQPARDVIRTLTMARLLARQGYRERALSIYTDLIAQAPGDASLRAEAEALVRERAV